MLPDVLVEIPFGWQAWKELHLDAFYVFAERSFVGSRAMSKMAVHHERGLFLEKAVWKDGARATQ